MRYKPNTGDVCQASVIFGVGKEKYRTEMVKSNNPTWNEEGIMYAIVFKVETRSEVFLDLPPNHDAMMISDHYVPMSFSVSPYHQRRLSY